VTPAEIIAAVRATGVALTAGGTSLVLKPAGRLAPALRAAVVKAKPQIVDILRGEADALLAISPICSECGEHTRISLVLDGAVRICSACASGLTALRRAGAAV
jgi:hypothetical protein